MAKSLGGSRSRQLHFCAVALLCRTLHLLKDHLQSSNFVSSMDAARESLGTDCEFSG